jgi:adenine-specific DNA-methyltransferase
MDKLVLRRLRLLARAAHRRPDRVPMCLYLAGVTHDWRPPARLRQTLRALRNQIADLDSDERHYVASTLYALSMGIDRRRRLSAFFTPPFVVRCAIDSAVRAGLDLRTHSVIDPAAGGAAFLSSVAARMRLEGCSPANVCARLHGIEIDPGLASLASALVSHRAGSKRSTPKILVGNSLSLLDGAHPTYDAVLANPPYGRATGTIATRAARHSEFVSAGHVNRYALFSGLATRMVRVGGVVVLVIPASFLTGPLFAPLRSHLRTTCWIEEVGMLATRQGAFLDVTQDACILTLRRSGGGGARQQRAVPFAVVPQSGGLHSRGTVELPADLAGPWRLPPESSLRSAALFSLASYGVEARSGYFVWNREKERMTRRVSTGAVPLIWAVNVRPGRPCWPSARSGKGMDFVKFPTDNAAIVRETAIVLQRTTNNRQRRRLVAAVVPSDVVKRFGGFVSENHTIVIRRKRNDVSLEELCALLGTAAVDREFRRLSTGAHVAVTALRDLPLPDPQLFSRFLKRTGDAERAAAESYQGRPPDFPADHRMAASR